MEALAQWQAFPFECVASGLLICSGGVSGATNSGEVPGDILAEARQMFENIGTVARAAGADLSEIVRVGIGVRDREETAEAINVAWLNTFPDPASRPARKTSIESRGVASGCRLSS